ncbi:MAG: serine/threonine-protein kinase [Proteobacteria bacterium]|nr:serine/threonine-protein kinase [Pseudomonadota bacterium]
MPPEAMMGMPTRVGRYEVISHLATGGMAQILLARQTGLGSFERHVVLKTILRERASDQRFVTMFLDEARLAATLNHQNVAQVYEVDQADGAYFMAMEYVHGENTRAILETSLRRGRTIPLELACMIISGAAAGLHHAHERRGKAGAPRNIVHRDVSPANIMVGFDGCVKVLDFGIAKAEERATKTVGGTIKGKYGYMSPEQCKGNPLDRRSDIFALGIVLYELTTLRRAFKGADDFETMKSIVSGDLVAPSVAIPGFPRELESIILTAMATDRTVRFQTAAEMIEAIDGFTVRAKLSGSGTAMGRFMTQLFGDKKEPWVHAPRDRQQGEVTTAMGSPQDGGASETGDNDNDNDDNDETVLSEGRSFDGFDESSSSSSSSVPLPPPPAAPSPVARYTPDPVPAPARAPVASSWANHASLSHQRQSASPSSQPVAQPRAAPSTLIGGWQATPTPSPSPSMGPPPPTQPAPPAQIPADALDLRRTSNKAWAFLAACLLVATTIVIIIAIVA